MKRLVLFILPFAFFLKSCESPEQREIVSSLDPNLEIKGPVKSLMASQVYEDISFQFLENTEPFISRPKRFKVSQKYIGVLDEVSLQLFVFSRQDGAFISNFHVTGDMPDALASIADFDFLDEEKVVVILDNFGKNLSKWSIEGAFLSKHNFDFYASRMLKNKSYYYLYDSNPKSRITTTLYCLNVLNEDFEHVGEYVKSNYEFVSESGPDFLTKNKNLTFITIPSSDTTYVLDGVNFIDTLVFKYGPNSITPSLHGELMKMEGSPMKLLRENGIAFNARGVNVINEDWLYYNFTMVMVRLGVLFNRSTGDYKYFANFNNDISGGYLQLPPYGEFVDRELIDMIDAEAVPGIIKEIDDQLAKGVGNKSRLNASKALLQDALDRGQLNPLIVTYTFRKDIELVPD